MDDGGEVSIGKTVQFSHGETEAADSGAGRCGVELWLTWLKLFHVEHWHLGTGDGNSLRNLRVTSIYGSYIRTRIMFHVEH